MSTMMEKKTQGQMSGESNAMASSLRVNNLWYQLPRSLSVAVSRSGVKNYPQKSDYKQGQTMVINLNTGTSFVDWSNSYITFSFQVTTTNAVNYNFGSGSIMNIFQSIKIQSRSGTELARLDKLALYANLQSKWKYSKDWLESFGTLQGFGQAPIAAQAGSDILQYVIPVRLLCGFFNPSRGKLCPPQLASGLRIEILLAQAANALTVSGASGGLSYEVRDLVWSLNSVNLMDSVMRSLNAQSSSNGLEYVYTRTFSSETQLPNGATQSNITLNKAVSFSNCAWAVQQPSSISVETNDPLGTVGHLYNF